MKRLLIPGVLLVLIAAALLTTTARTPRTHTAGEYRLRDLRANAVKATFETKRPQGGVDVVCLCRPSPEDDWMKRGVTTTATCPGDAGNSCDCSGEKPKVSCGAAAP